MKWTQRLEALQVWAEDQPPRLLLVATTAFLAAGLLAFTAHFIHADDWIAMSARTLLAVPFVLASLAGLLALGAWLAVLAESTWRQRLRLRILSDPRPTGPEKKELQHLAEGTHGASDILQRGRRLAWTAGTMAIPGGLLILSQAGFFAASSDATTLVFAALFPLPLVALLAFIRGMQLVLDGRRLVRDLDPGQPPAKRAKGEAA